MMLVGHPHPKGRSPQALPSRKLLPGARLRSVLHSARTPQVPLPPANNPSLGHGQLHPHLPISIYLTRHSKLRVLRAVSLTAPSCHDIAERAGVCSFLPEWPLLSCPSPGAKGDLYPEKVQHGKMKLNHTQYKRLKSDSGVNLQTEGSDLP